MVGVLFVEQLVVNFFVLGCVVGSRVAPRGGNDYSLVHVPYKSMASHSLGCPPRCGELTLYVE